MIFHVDLVLLCSILFSNRDRNHKRPLNVLARTDLTAFFVNKKLNQIICFSLAHQSMILIIDSMINWSSIKMGDWLAKVHRLVKIQEHTDHAQQW